MDSDYLWDGSGPPDPEIRRLERLLGRLRHRSVDVSVSKWRSPKRLVPLAIAASLLIALGITRQSDQEPAETWTYHVLSGAPTIGEVTVTASGQMNAGDWLETDGESRVVLTLASVGEIEIEPYTRIGFIPNGNQGRLSLQRGTVHALTSTSLQPFTIETPTATAVDTDGDYYLTVDDSGGAFLCVSDGWVSFASNGRRSIVPAGAVCETRPGVGPGTPRCENGPDKLRIALDRFDFVAQGSEALASVLRESGPCDLLPLWHILRRVESTERERVYDRMTGFSPAPEGVTRDGVLSLDNSMLEYWWSQIWNNRACLLCAEGYEPPSS